MTARAKPRKASRRRPDVETYARQTERLIRSLIRDQTAQVRATGESFDVVRVAHDERHRGLERRLAAVEQGQAETLQTLTELRRMLEEMRSVIEPLREILGRFRASHLRAAAPPPAPPDPVTNPTTAPARVAGA